MTHLPPDTAPASSVSPTRLVKFFTWICWLYLAFVIGSWLILRFGGDIYWLPTLMLFGPHYIYALPLFILIPSALVIRRRLLLPLAISLMPLLAIVGFTLPLGKLRPASAGPRLRILTCNVDGKNGAGVPLGDLIYQEHPDIIALQEWETDGVPTANWPAEYHWIVSHNLLFASHYPIREVTSLFDQSLHGPGAVVEFEAQMPTGKLNFFNLHLATPREGLEPLMQEGLDGVGAMDHSIMSRWRESHLALALIQSTSGPMLISGDMNTPCESAIFRKYWSRYQDAWSEVGFGLGYSKFTRFWGIRIDHILADQDWRFLDCHVGPDVGSDHRPVIADLQWTGNPSTLSFPATQPSP